MEIHKSTASMCLESASDSHHHESLKQYNYSGSCVFVVAAAASSESHLGSRKVVVDSLPQWRFVGASMMYYGQVGGVTHFASISTTNGGAFSDKNRIYDDATVSVHQKKERSTILHSMGRSAKMTMMYVHSCTEFLQTCNA